jgi:hypothetical protein
MTRILGIVQPARRGPAAPAAGAGAAGPGRCGARPDPGSESESRTGAAALHPGELEDGAGAAAAHAASRLGYTSNLTRTLPHNWSCHASDSKNSVGSMTRLHNLHFKAAAAP